VARTSSSSRYLCDPVTMTRARLKWSAARAMAGSRQAINKSKRRIKVNRYSALKTCVWLALGLHRIEQTHLNVKTTSLRV
jgi:hypothetical protein